MFSPKHLIVAASFALAALTPLRAEVSPVRIRIEQTSKTENDKENKTSIRTLKIFVTNGSAEPLELKVKHTFFGRSVPGHDIVTVAEGEKAITVAPRATETVETAPGKALFVDEHTKDKKKVEAAGTKMIGYGVRVMQGEKIMAETYDPLSLKESWGKVVPVMLPSTPKK